MNLSTALNEEDIRPADLMQRKASALEADKRFLLERRASFVEVDCPACDESMCRPWAEKEGVAYRECICCGTLFTSPRPTEAILAEFYGGSENYAFWNEHIFPTTETVRRERIIRPRAERLASYCQSLSVETGTLLEIGAAYGTFCAEVQALGLFKEIIALEPTPSLAQTCRDRGFRVLEMPVELVEQTQIADVVAAFEVIEHLFAPRDFLFKVRRLLRPGGLLILSCPNAHGFDNLTLGVRSGTFDHEHLNYFNPRSMRELLTSAGLEVLQIETPGLLDADLVRKASLRGDIDISSQPFLQRVLLDDWETLGQRFQDFLATSGLSSHMWSVARNP